MNESGTERQKQVTPWIETIPGDFGGTLTGVQGDIQCKVLEDL